MDFEEIVVDRNTSRPYRKEEFLGMGSFGQCYKMRDLISDETFAVKIIPQMYTEVDEDWQEIQILKKLQHKHVVSFSHSFECQDYIYILMELCSRKTLVNIIEARGTLTNPEVRYYMHQLISGLKYIHEKGYIHRDIKLDNLLINDNMELKIGDFGSATELKPGIRDLCGTPFYRAPEVWKMQEQGPEADVWSLGCIIYILLVGDFPFDGQNWHKRLLDAEYTLPWRLSRAARKVTSRILRKNPEDRLTLDEILRQKFFKGFTPEKLPVSSCDTVPQLRPANRIRRFFIRLAQVLFRRNRSNVQPQNGRKESRVQVPSNAKPAESIKTNSDCVDQVKNRPVTIQAEAKSRKSTKSSWRSLGQWFRRGCTKSANEARKSACQPKSPRWNWTHPLPWSKCLLLHQQPLG
ncbi:serine/threonine-protein kinase PLK3-like [Paramormyrops kingsleyae]|uniref:serine/threonine-protein kinase PLK3-like n=1 Tax=Paramormyrops kingsleyae TaxID=1676925 RepID=UPI003B97C5AA